MLVNPANLAYFFTQLDTRWNAAYSVAETWSERYATQVGATTENFMAGWMGMIDKYRKWNGSRTIRTPAPQTYLVNIFPYELTLEIDKFKLQDDQYGIYFPMIAMMGLQAKKHPDYLLRDLIFNTGDQTGAVQNGFDGLTHWNTAHPVDYWDSSKGTYCNDFRSGGVSVNGVTVGGGLTVNGFGTAWEEFGSRKSESGEALGIRPDLTWCAEQNRANGMTILQASSFGAPVIGTIGNSTGANAPMVGATTNIYQGWTDLHVNADFNAYPTIWGMLATKGPIKPFGDALRAAPDFTYRNSPQDPTVFDKHVYLLGSEDRRAPMWGFAWQSLISGP